ncbi:hypothetical protein OC844_005959 [Tilletia horrida]|nr:hypothetical protein OC844_005959 [Tilletia horrida]
MVPGQPQEAEAQPDTARNSTTPLQRPPKSLHRVPSKHLGSGSGAGLWLSTGNSPAEKQNEHESGADAQARVRFHDSAKPQAVSPTAATPTSRGSKLYHFPATLARGLRFLAADSSESPENEENDPVAKLQEHNLLRMTSKEELEASVDLDLSFDYVSTAERPSSSDYARRSVLAPVNLQEAFTPAASTEPVSRDSSERAAAQPLGVTSTPTSMAKTSPGRGMAATNWSSRPAKQPPAPLDLAGTNPSKQSFERQAAEERHSRSNSRTTQPSVDIERANSIATMRSLDSAKVVSTPSLEAEPRASDSMSFMSHRSNQSRSSRSSRAPPTQPPSGPLPPIPDGISSTRGSLSSSSRIHGTLKPIDNVLSDGNDSQEEREELQDSDQDLPDGGRKRTSMSSTYSGESGDSFQTAGIGSQANSSAENISGSGSQISTVPPLPTVPSVIWRQRQQRIERQVAAAATTRASAVPAAFAIDSVVIDNSAVVRAPVPPPPDQSPRMSFGFQSPTPEKIKRWSSIPSQLAAMVASADGPIQPPAVPALATNAASSALSPPASSRMSIANTPSTDTSMPFSPLFSDPGTAISVGTTMSRTSTQSASAVKPGNTQSLGHASSKLEEDAADVTMTTGNAGQKRGSVGTVQWIRDQSTQQIPVQRQSCARDSFSSVRLGDAHKRQTSNATGLLLTSDSEIEGDEERARKRRLPMHITTESESSHAETAASVLGLQAADVPSSPWPQSPHLLTQDAQSRISRDFATSQASNLSRAQRSSQLNSMLGLGLGLDLGLGADLQQPKDAHLSLSASASAIANRESLLRKTASDSGLANPRRQSTNSPHTEIDMTMFADQGPEPTASHMHSDMHLQKLTSRRSRLLDMLHGSGQASAAPLSSSTAVAVNELPEGSGKAGATLAAADTPSTLPMLSPRPMSSPYLGRFAMDISANSSVEAFACNVTPPMPSATFNDKQPASILRATERKSEGHLLNSSWLNQAQNVRSRLSYRIATASWMPQQPTKQEMAETSEGRANNRVSIASTALNPDARMRRRRSTVTTAWAPASNLAAILRSVPRTIALGQPKRRRTVVMFGNAAFNSPARTPATTNMLPNGTLLSKSLFFAGFCGMPWLWLVGGWWLGPDGMLVSDMLTKVEIIDDGDSDDSDSDADVDFVASNGKKHEDDDAHSEWQIIGPDGHELSEQPKTSAEHFHELIHGPGSTGRAGSPAHLHPNSAALQRGGSAEGQQSSSATSVTHSPTAITSDHDTSMSSGHDQSAYPRVRMLKGKKSGSLAEYYDAIVHPVGLEQYVRYNRIASVFGSAFIFVALVLAIWGVALNW